MTIEHINPDRLLKFAPLSQVVVARAARTAYIAGQSACNENYEMIGTDHYEQSLQALGNLRTAVESAGGTVDRIVSSTVYLKNLTPETGGRFIDALSSALDGQPFPAHAFSMIGVEALASPDALVEISAIVALRD